MRYEKNNIVMNPNICIFKEVQTLNSIVPEKFFYRIYIYDKRPTLLKSKYGIRSTYPTSMRFLEIGSMSGRLNRDLVNEIETLK